MEVTYDCEVFPNVFTVVVMPHALGDDRHWVYEVSNRRNDAATLAYDLRNGSITRMHGFNVLAYDYPMLHRLLELIDQWGTSLPAAYITAELYKHSLELIAAEKGFMNHVKPWHVAVPQVDWYAINHFDNPAKKTGGLKGLEFNIESPSIEEMPFEYGAVLADDQIDTLLGYNLNDVRETKRFAHLCHDALVFREQLVAQGMFGPECINWNDVKIGERFFIQKLEAAKPGITRNRADGRKPQTWRNRIRLADIIVPYVEFERYELRELLGNLRAVEIAGTETKGAYKFPVTLDGFTFDIGQGGIHGSVDRRTVRTDATHVIMDIDATGFYPSVAIVNRFAPAHIGPVFADVYRDIRDTRTEAKRAGRTVEAGTLKLSNNGAFGKTLDKHSVLYDPQCGMAITVNGQLLQCMLAEALLRVRGLELLQMNTDGLTVYLPRAELDAMWEACHWWERQVCIELEYGEYREMHIRDVNAYVAVTTDGKVKRKGAYDWQMLSGSTGGQKAWHRDFSALVVAKAAEAALVDDQCPADFIANHQVPYDFLLRAKVDGGSRLELSHSGRVLGKVVRYYVSKTGEPMVKLMPPLKGKTEFRRIGIHAEGQAECLGERNDYRCSMCGERFINKSMFHEHNKNRHSWPVTVKQQWDGDLTGIDHRWYVAEAEKLIW